MRHRRSLWVCLAVVVLLASVAVPAQVVKKGQHTLDDLVMASGRLQVPQAVVPGDQLRAESLAAGDKVMEGVFENWDGFLRDNGTTWEMMVDRRGGRVALVSGSGVPWVPGKGNSLRKADIQGDLGGGGKVNNRTLLRLAQRFMERYPELFGVDPSDLTVMPGGTGEYGGYLWYVQLQRNYAGIPVEDSYIVFRVNNGNLVQFGGENLGRINVDPMPSIDAETARQILQGYVGSLDDSDEWVNPGALSILPMAPAGDAGFFNARPGDGTEFRLVYTVAFRREGVMGTWEAKIDAHTGEILSFLDTNKYGGVTGGIWKVANNESSETIMPMPFAGVSGQYANAAGVYPQTSGSVSASFTGKYVKVTDSCGTSALAGTAPADLAFSKSTGSDCTTPGVGGAGNTHAARSTYYHITNWKVKAMSWLPSNSWLTGQVGDKVNLNQTCNAYWDGSAVNFFKSGGGCSNTGELPTVFLHEIGHGLDSNDGSPASKVGSSESYADINALLMTHASCIGVNFIPGQQCSGYGNACTACTGIRDADYTKHTNSTSPATPAQLANTTGFHCSKSSSYPGPCGYEGHCESYIMSEVGWDLAAKDLPAAGIDANTSWFIADRLFMLTRPTSGDSYTCPAVTTANGCGTSNWFQTYLVADDDNGNLSDGTPHAAAIYAAFNRHLIACTTTVHTNSTTCASIGQPTLTATAGTGTVSLSWTAASGATSYTVLRNEMSATSGMTIIAKGVTGTTYTDNVVAAGITYYYAVVGNTGTITSVGSCFGALSAVKSATPSGGTPPVTYSISGTVSGATASGVTMSLTGAATASTTTDAGYVFEHLQTFAISAHRSGIRSLTAITSTLGWS